MKYQLTYLAINVSELKGNFAEKMNNDLQVFNLHCYIIDDF